MKQTHCEKILELLSDTKWHSFNELNHICYRYSARLHDLKKQGYLHENKTINGVSYYKLVTK
jgi:hypothetical protein